MSQISVVIPSYNHERYIEAALESVISQTYTDYELIISDDASIDRSVDVIEEFIAKHPKIPSRLIKNKTNLGGVLNLNQLISQSSSKYIALLNSDDKWAPEKLETQLKYLEQHPETAAVFTQAVIVDEQGIELSKQDYLFSDVFFQQNRSRGEWLQKFFFEQNCLCHPSVLIQRDIYSKIGYYDPRFRQIPDFEMWVRLVKHAEIHIIEHPMVSLLWHENNTSAINHENSQRGYHEILFILRDFFVDMSDDILIDGFQKYFRKQNASESAELTCEKAFLYFIETGPLKDLYQNIGLDKLFSLLDDPVATKTLAERYQFSYQDLIALVGAVPFDSVTYPGLPFPKVGPDQSNEIPEPTPQVDEMLAEPSWKEMVKRLLRKSPIMYRVASNVWRQMFRRLG